MSEPAEPPTTEDQFRQLFMVATRRTGRRLRPGMSPAQCAAIHARELARVGIRDVRFDAAALTLYYSRALEFDIATQDAPSRRRWRLPRLALQRRNPTGVPS